ncbi:hypothetical protein D3C75_1225030 [compost metagenome]
MRFGVAGVASVSPPATAWAVVLRGARFLGLAVVVPGSEGMGFTASILAWRAAIRSITFASGLAGAILISSPATLC